MKTYLYLGKWSDHLGNFGEEKKFCDLTEFDFTTDYNYVDLNHKVESNNPVVLTFKMGHRDLMVSECMKMLSQNQLNTFTFFFYDKIETLKSDLKVGQTGVVIPEGYQYNYHNCYVVDGYVVDVYNEAVGNTGETLVVKILVSSIKNLFIDGKSKDTTELYISK